MAADEAQLIALFDFGRRLFCTPNLIDKRTSRLWSVACLFHVTIVTVMFVYHLKLRVAILTEEGVPKTLMLVMAVAAITAWLFCLFHLMAATYDKSPKTISQNISSIRAILKNTDFVISAGFCANKYYTRTCQLTILLYLVFCLATAEAARPSDSRRMFFGYIHYPECLAGVYLIYKIFMMYALTRYLKRRYAYLIASVEHLLDDRKLPENMVMWKIKRIEKVVRLNYQLASGMKISFGWFVLLSVIFSVTSCLYAISYTLLCFKTGHFDLGYLCSIFGNCTLFAVSTVIAILELDRLKTIGNRLTNATYRVRRHVANVAIEEELTFLAKYSKELLPAFTAVYLNVDKRLISSSLSVIATYIIVIVQFSLSKFDPIVLRAS